MTSTSGLFRLCLERISKQSSAALFGLEAGTELRMIIFGAIKGLLYESL